MSEDIYRSQFRMPYSLYEKIKESADANRRSVNAELVARLEESFEPRYVDADAPLLVRELSKSGLSGQTISTFPSPENLVGIVSDMVEHMRLLSEQVKELRDAQSSSGGDPDAPEAED